MMKPEETIAAFLEVWENNPELFLAADVENDLDSLKTAITTKDDIAKEIREWCKKHSNVRDAVRLASRKFDPNKNFPTRPEEDRTLDNRYPEISQVLRDKLRDKLQEKEDKSGET